MNKSLAAVIAGAALIAGNGLATAQQMEGLETFSGHINRSIQEPGEDELANPETPSERRPDTQAESQQSTMQGHGQGRSVGFSTLSQGQRSKLHETVASGNFHRLGSVNLVLSIGTRIPDIIKVYSLPETIAVIVPQYRGFKYVITQKEMIIVNPDTREIVAVLPV